MARLDRIRIAGFKSIRDQTVELRPLNVLIGANGAGKSNFIGVFRLLHEIEMGSLQLFVARTGGADRMLHYGRKVTDHLLLNLHFGHSSYLCDLVPTAGDSLAFAQEEVVLQKAETGSTQLESFGAGHKEAKAPSAEPKVADFVISALESWQVYHFNDTSEAARVKQTGDLHDNTILRPDAGNLAAFLYRLRETRVESYRNIIDVVRMVAPFFGSFTLQPDRLNPDKIKLEWQEHGSDAYFDAHSISDGTLRFICLATLLLQPELPSLILLDEPELGLHPYAITVLADLLRSAATRTQVVVSTQSVTLVNQLSPEDVLVVDREDGASIFRRLTEDEIATWLDDYALGELWEKNILGGRPGA
jgi:predicted ATPase